MPAPRGRVACEANMAARALAPLVALAIILCCGVNQAACECGAATLSSRLDSLLAEYDRETPPGSRVVVQVTLDVRHASINEQASTLRLLADLHLSWQDDRISWNASDWGCDWALADAERLWTPDVALAGAASAAAEPLAARLTSAGAAAWAVRLDASVPIALSLRDWPNDKQVGLFKFACRAHGVDEISLETKGDRFTVFESGAWEVSSLQGEDELLPAGDGAGTARALAAWRVGLRRRAPAQQLAARVALATALLLLATAALLPATARPPLAAAAAFISAIWLCTAVWRVSGGAAAPRAVVLQGAVCACAAALALGAAAVTRVARLRSAPPAAVRAVLGAVGRLLMLAPPPEARTSDCSSVRTATATPPLASADRSLRYGSGVGGVGGVGAWAAAARALDAALLALLALVLVVLLAVYL